MATRCNKNLQHEIISLHGITGHWILLLQRLQFHESKNKNRMAIGYSQTAPIKWRNEAKTKRYTSDSM